MLYYFCIVLWYYTLYFYTVCIRQVIVKYNYLLFWWLYDSGTICTNKVSGEHICFDCTSKNIFYILLISV